jgi:hypothetical protein
MRDARLISEWLMVASTTFLLCGCYSEYDYTGPPDAAIKYGSGPAPVNPALYRVNADDFPRYRVSSVRQPPRAGTVLRGVLREFPEPLAAVLPSDIWKVRYKFKDFLAVNSFEFDHRECLAEHPGGSKRRMKPDGTCQYDWCLYISVNGTVTGGWDNCTLGYDRIMFKPDPAAVQLQNWGAQPFFEVIPRLPR